ncbi:8071_t:CDS:2, partial [Entrophospora sp. SA101]
VCQMAIKILEELCDRNIDNIELMIKYRPYLDHLGEFGNNLLLKFLSTPIGFNYLYEINYLERELIDWFNGNIGSSKNGLTFLDEENIIKEIVHIAENSNVLSLRG